MKFFIIAIIAILVLGLGAIGIFHYVLNVQYQGPSKESQLIGAGPVTRERVSLTFNLTSPDDNSISFGSDTLVSGKTSPNAVVILDLNNSYTSLEANSLGDFSTTLKLEQGINNLTATVFDELGNSKTESRTVYYSKEKL